MIPKTLHLSYDHNFSANDSRIHTLPKAIHTRPSAAELTYKQFDNGNLVRAIARSEYDEYNDIYVDMDVVGDEAHVRSLWLEENK